MNDTEEIIAELKKTVDLAQAIVAGKDAIIQKHLELGEVYKGQIKALEGLFYEERKMVVALQEQVAALKKRIS